jgi:hypothetical protein
MGSCKQRECERRQKKMQDRDAQGVPRPLTVNAAGVEEPPDIPCSYDQAE